MRRLEGGGRKSIAKKYLPDAAPPLSKSTKAARRVTRQGEDRAPKRSTRRDLPCSESRLESCARQHPPNRKPQENSPGSSTSRGIANLARATNQLCWA